MQHVTEVTASSEERLRPGQIWQHIGEHHVRALRNPWYRMLAFLQNDVTELTGSFWAARGAKNMCLPVTTGSISSPMGLGSDSRPVKVNLEGADLYLADSMQFALEYGCRLTGCDTWYLMPSFRGEDLDATHLAQFFHSEAEISGDLDDVMEVVREYLVHLAGGLLERRADQIGAAGGDLGGLETLALGGTFRRMTFDEAAELVGADGIIDSGEWRTLTRAGEKTIIDKVGQFTWVTHWDHLSVPFYQAFEDTDGRFARNGDLLFGIGETVGAGERHETADQVRHALDVHKVSHDSYEWYCELRDSVAMRTSGFGMGIERFLMWVLRHDDIRDMQLLPRANGQNIIP